MNLRLSNITGTLTRALKLIWMSSPSLALWHSLLAFVLALLPLLSLLALKKIVDSASLLYKSGALEEATLLSSLHLYSSNATMATLIHWTLLAVFCLVTSAFLKIAVSWISEFHSIAVTDEVYRKLHATLTNADFAFFENPDDQNNLYLAREQAVSRPMQIIRSMNRLIQSATSLIGGLIILFSLVPLLPLLLCLSAIPGMYLKLIRSRHFFQWRRQLIPKERECSYFHSIMTSNEGAKEIRLYGHADFCQDKFQKARDYLKVKRKTWRKAVLRYDLAGMSIGFAAAGAALLWLLEHTLTGTLTIGTFVLCIQALRRGQGVITTISETIASLLEDSIFLQSYEELINRKPRICAPKNPAPLPVPLKKGIDFENVSFTYQGSASPALCNVSLSLQPGQRIALAGSNGAGKSTLIKLLCRLYEPSAGRILVDGTDLKYIDPVKWRRQIGVLFEDFNTYQLSAEDNIRIGHPDFQQDDPHIARAADSAGLSACIKSWPHGLKTLLGRWLHDGIEPSMGQWQKLALARTFLRPASIYLLDEPTSALDGIAQKEMLESLKILSEGRLTLFTSHRSLPIGMADRVVLLENGRVTVDTTTEKISNNDVFKGLFKQD
ncbi:MAG: ABC transporter ATP-binding protein [Kiritimatiellia bacterium]